MKIGEVISGDEIKSQRRPKGSGHFWLDKRQGVYKGRIRIGKKDIYMTLTADKAESIDIWNGFIKKVHMGREKLSSSALIDNVTDLLGDRGCGTTGMDSGNVGVSAASEVGGLLLYPWNLIVTGAPGVGKSWRLREKIIGMESVIGYKSHIVRTTFYPGYNYGQFVGVYKPVTDFGSGGKTTYRFVPGVLMRLLVEALNNFGEECCLIIEELNRANAPMVFGDMFQLLDRREDGMSEYGTMVSEDIWGWLEKEVSPSGLSWLESEFGAGHIGLPSNFRVWATMNNADQNVMALDTAFKRRWEFEYVGIDENAWRCAGWKIGGCGISWDAWRRKANSLMVRCGVDEDKLLGPFFARPKVGDEIDERQFKYKVLGYLWEDSCRMFRRELFGADIHAFSDLADAWPNVFRGLKG